MGRRTIQIVLVLVVIVGAVLFGYRLLQKKPMPHPVTVDDMFLEFDRRTEGDEVLLPSQGRLVIAMAPMAMGGENPALPVYCEFPLQVSWNHANEPFTSAWKRVLSDQTHIRKAIRYYNAGSVGYPKSKSLDAFVGDFAHARQHVKTVTGSEQEAVFFINSGNILFTSFDIEPSEDYPAKVVASLGWKGAQPKPAEGQDPSCQKLENAIITYAPRQ